MIQNTANSGHLHLYRPNFKLKLITGGPKEGTEGINNIFASDKEVGFDS